MFCAWIASSDKTSKLNFLCQLTGRWALCQGVTEHCDFPDELVAYNALPVAPSDEYGGEASTYDPFKAHRDFLD